MGFVFGLVSSVLADGTPPPFRYRALNLAPVELAVVGVVLVGAAILIGIAITIYLADRSTPISWIPPPLDLEARRQVSPASFSDQFQQKPAP